MTLLQGHDEVAAGQAPSNDPPRTTVPHTPANDVPARASTPSSHASNEPFDGEEEPALPPPCTSENRPRRNSKRSEDRDAGPHGQTGSKANSVSGGKNEPFEEAEVKKPGVSGAHSGGSASGDGGEEEDGSSGSRSNTERVSPLELFRYADRLDVVLMIVGAIAAMGAGAGMPAFSFAMGRLVADLLTTDPAGKAAESAAIMTYIGIGEAACCVVHVACWCVTAVRQVTRIRSLYFAALLRQDIGWHDAHRPGELTARMTGDTQVVQNGINDRLSLGLANLCMGIFGFIFGFVFCWEETLVMLGMMPFVALCGALFGNVLAKATSATRKEFAAAGSIATEVMENIRTVQVFGREAFEAARFEEAVKRAEKPGMKREFLNAVSVGSTLALIFLSYCVVFIFAAYLMEWGRTTIEDIVSTFLSVLFGSIGIGFFFPSLTAFTESRSAAYALFRTIERVPPIDIDAEGEPVEGFHSTVEFSHVRFSYPTRPDQVLFTDLNLTIKKGQKVAFSGASGCGKSSIIGLIQRFYDPVDGCVEVDGVDMRRLDLYQWRDLIGIVSQEPNLFAGSIIANVRVGRADATYEEVVEVCKQANIHDTIMSLPNQYNTPVGSVGSQLSGGQKQRIAIARALIKRPAILLLDEATSALDRKSEVEVQSSLDALMRESSMTIIVIAHRLATIRNVDCIYYVSYDGVRGSVIAEQGTFDELVSRGGLFAAMVKSQNAAHPTATTAAALSSSVQASGAESGGSVFAPQGDDAAAAHVEEGGGAEDMDAAVGGGYGVVLSEKELARLDEEAPRTERQKVPIDQLAGWEVSRVNVGMRRLLGMNRSNLWAIALGLLGSLMAGAVAPVNTILMGKLLNVLADYYMFQDADEMHRKMNTYAPIFVGISGGALIGWVLQFFYGYAGELLTTKLRGMLFRQILRQDMSFFDIPGRDAGTLSGMLSGECEAIHQLCGQAIGIRLQTACTILVGLVIGLVYQWTLALIAMACLPLIMLAVYSQQSLMRGATQNRECDSDDTIVTEALSNVRTVTSFNLKRNRTDAFNELVERKKPSILRRNIIIGVIYGLSQFVYYGSFALCYWYGGKLIAKGKANYEEVNVASLSVLMGAMSAGEAGGFATKLSDAEKASRRVFSVIDRVPDVDVNDPTLTEEVNFTHRRGCDVAFRRTQFMYPARPNQVVLNSVDMDFREGTTNGLMGQTGCGKSTIIQLLARFYPFRRGEILINNEHHLDKLSVAAWRQHVSIVLQEPDLFSGTVRDNIAYSVNVDAGEVPATEEEIVQAAKWASIHDDIMAMPEGYDTQVGYKGRALSGGQKQRVAIARGLLRRSTKLLLLDEATSALDNATEAKVQDGVEAFLTARRLTSSGSRITVISIAHRLTTIRDCDQIVLLDGGRIRESGSHDQLMKLDGEYRTRWELYAAGTSCT